MCSWVQKTGISLDSRTFLLLALQGDAPGDEVACGTALLRHDLPHLVMAVGPLEGRLRGGAERAL